MQNSIKSLSKGSLIICLKSKWVWLKNDKKETIRKGAVSEEFLKDLLVVASAPRAGSFIDVAGYSIEILNEKEKKVLPNNTKENSINTSNVVSTDDLPGNIQTDPILSVAAQPQLDHVLMRSMKVHQIEAAKFILNRLLDDPAGAAKDNRAVSCSHIPLTGAVLADDMGTGKTLVAIAVVWALVRHGRGKGIIVCPSSLISNWKKEIAKWMQW